MPSWGQKMEKDPPGFFFISCRVEWAYDGLVHPNEKPMRPILLVPALIVVIPLTGQSTATRKPPSRAQETPPYIIGSECIRQICEMREIQLIADAEKAEGNNEFMDAIRNATRIKIALKTDILNLKQMKPTKTFKEALTLLAGLYQQKYKLYDQLIDISTQFLSGPKPGVDYGVLGAQVPQIRATLEDMDRTLFKTCPVILFLIVDQKPDSEGHVSHFTITREQRDSLVKELDDTFGEKLNEKNQSYNIATASVLKDGLNARLCSDDPW